MDRGFFVGGEWVSAPGAERFEILCPATGDRIGSTALASPADIDRAVQAATASGPRLRQPWVLSPAPRF